MHITHESASLKLRSKEGYMLLTNLYSIKRGHGHATELMRLVCEYADREDIILGLEVGQFGDVNGLNNDQLKIFYAKFGFEIIKGSMEMGRVPASLAEITHPIMTPLPTLTKESHA